MKDPGERPPRVGLKFALRALLACALVMVLTGTAVDNWFEWAVKHGVAPEYPGPVTPGPSDPAGMLTTGASK